MDSEQRDSESRIGGEGLNLSSRELLTMSLGSLVLYLFISTLLYYFVHEKSLFSVFADGESIGTQLLTGIGSGTAAALIILFFSTRPPMSRILDDFTIFRVISKTRFSTFDKIQISLFAGTGEELLFRGAIQPLMGIWLTSVLFIAIHGYISVKSAGHALFTVLLVGLSVMLGFLFELVGLVSAIAAHSVYDLIMLWWAGQRQGDNQKG